MNKRAICPGIALFLICMFCATKGKADAALNITGPSSISIGDSFTINAVVSQAADLYGFQFDLGFDPTILQATGFTEGTFLTSLGSTFFFNNGIDNAAGSVASNVDTLVGAPSGGDGGGTLMTFDFTAIGSGTSDITISNVLLSDSNGDPLQFSVENGSVDVAGIVVTTPEPSALSMVLAASLLVGLLRILKR